MRKPEGKRVSGAGGAAASGSMDHSEKNPGLSLEEKRQLVHGIAQCLDDAPAVLKSFKKKELLELICAEVGMDQKFAGLTKSKMIQCLLQLLSKKCKKETETVIEVPSPMQEENKLNKQQKNKYLSQLSVESSHSDEEMAREDPKDRVCGNLACRALVGADDVFCKRCSCCICHRFDENKDPSLWLTCDFNSLEKHEPCGISCHLKCALDQKSPGNLKKGDSENPDDFCCVFCGTPYGVMRTWRKQIVAASEARRVDVLCLRLALGHKILIGSDKYEGLLKTVESAVIALEDEVGPLDLASETMDRSIVNRLSCGAAVQKLCASALEAFESLMGGPCLNPAKEKEAAECKILIEVMSPTKVAVNLEYEPLASKDLLSCRLWHRTSGADYPMKPTFTELGPVKTFELCSLDPSTEYSCKVSFLSRTGVMGSWEASWKTPAAPSEDQAMSDSDNMDAQNANAPKQTESLHQAVSDDMDAQNATENAQKQTESMHQAVSDNMDALNANAQKQTESMSSSDDLSKETLDSRKKSEEFPSVFPFPKKQQVSDGPSTPSQSDGTQQVPNSGNQRQLKETDYEYAVRVIRKLEHEGHLESDFRVKFLTWFSLKATLREKRVVSIFIDTFSDDPPSLAGQLLHTFKDRICNDRKMASPRFCTRLWH